MRGRSRTVLRALVVATVAVSPLAALQADAAVNTGNATASGPGISIQNTGGNVTYGVGHSESKVVVGDGGAAPLATPNNVSTLSTPVDPGASARAHARAMVDAAKLRAQQQIDAAKAAAEAAVERAKAQADEARARGAQQSSDAQSHAESSSGAASANSSGD